MARRQGFFDELLTIGSKLPWRVATFSAVRIFVGLRVAAVQTSSPATGTTLGSRCRQNMSMSLITQSI